MNPHKSAREIRILPGRELVLGLPCMSCEHRASAELRRPEAINILRRVLAYTNFAGASESEIKDASVVIQRAGSAEEVVAGASIGSPTLGSIPHLNGVALEIALMMRTNVPSWSGNSASSTRSGSKPSRCRGCL